MSSYRTASDLRQDVARCRALAEKAKDPNVGAGFSNIADAFENLARQVEELTKHGHWPLPNSK